MLINIGGRFKIEDYIVDKNKVTLITNIKPDFDILRQSKTLEIKPLVKTAKIVTIAPKESDFVYIRNRAVSAGNVIENKNGADLVPIDEFYKFFEKYAKLCRGANDNGDFFSHEELINTYKTFIGKPVFVDHNNENVENARGIILDAVYNDKWKFVELLKAIDKKAFPELARGIEAGYMDSTSMGCRCGYSLCSICGNKAVAEDDFCDHILHYKGMMFNGLPVFEDNRMIEFFESSLVGTPADPECKVLEKVASKNILPKTNVIKQNSNNSKDNKFVNEMNQRFSNNRINTLANKLENLPWT